MRSFPLCCGDLPALSGSFTGAAHPYEVRWLCKKKYINFTSFGLLA